MKNYFLMLLLVLSLAACSGGNDNEVISNYVNAPSGITVERLDKTKVLLKWTDNSDNETGFTILLRKADTSVIQEIGKVGANETQVTINQGIEEGNIYFFGVKAFSETNASRPVYVLYRMGVWVDPPSVSLVGDVKGNASCIYAYYQAANIAGVTGIESGLCWSSTGTPTIDDAKQVGPALPTDGSKIMQVIPNVLLEYGKTYKVRAYLKTSTAVYYSAESTASLSSEVGGLTLSWTKLSKSSLPSEIEVYETTSTLNGKKFHAWYAIADLSTGNVELRVNLPSAPATVDAQAASFNGDCYVLTNGGYFYNTSAVGLTYVNSAKTGAISAVRGSLISTDTEYDSMYSITRGIFGVDANNKAGVYWAGTDASNNALFFDRPLPSVKGEAKYAAVSSTNPTAPVTWAPKYAVSAGPVLLKNGKIPFDFELTSNGTDFYLSNFEIIPYDIFGPTVSPDRTAVGYRSDGKVILFVCDGRIETSEGATLVELAQILKGLGCTNAINLDGGGSTGMVVGSDHLNDMTANGSAYNRAVVTTIGFFKKK